ncbi:MAG: DUF192 domain-containing protein [Anaerolineaceae bacterium]|nr:DUF192 domain-containing protein [Anaerolineaceae bacterium]
MKKVKLQNVSHPLSQPCEVNYCTSFYAKFIGLMFQKEITPFSGIVLVEKHDSMINSTIHMLFMNFDISAIWINQSGFVVDKVIAKRWHLAYAPRQAANRVFEMHTQHYDDFSIGDQISCETL